MFQYLCKAANPLTSDQTATPSLGLSWLGLSLTSSHQLFLVPELGLCELWQGAQPGVTHHTAVGAGL